MGVLRNTRHEAFAQAVANGHSAFKAHEIAGFFPDRANAGRLRHRDDISRRVDEILAARTKAIDKALVSAAERVGVDEEWVLRKLRMNAVMAMRAGDRAAANRSIELIGRHLGMFIERKQSRLPTSTTPTSTWRGSWRSSTLTQWSKSRRPWRLTIRWPRMTTACIDC
jgi:hypothetical protein